MLYRRASISTKILVGLTTIVSLFLIDIEAQNASVRALRLPNTTFPLRYYLHISSNIHLEDFKYSGNVTIDIEVRESTNEIVLHAKNLKDFTITVHELSTGDLMDNLTYSYDLNAHFLIIHPIENYQAFELGLQYRIEILFEANMNEQTVGIYWLTYSNAKNETVYLAATQFEPARARLAFPCYDEPAFKANFTIKLTHGRAYMAISNMQVQQTFDHVKNDEAMTTTTFYTTPPISTYLVAFVISDFVFISEEYRGVLQRVFTSPTTVDKGHKALKNAVRTVAALEDFFGINYPLAKLDHIALQKNYGAAMENWGLITYKEDSLVVHNDADLHEQLKDILTQNHEIVHQWFGNLVSPEWWTYAWLNEGFATYFSYIITDVLYPDYKTMDFFLTDIAERAYSYSHINVRPMTSYVEKESEILSIFDIITYQRAACVIKMFHHAFNQKTFVRGMSKFLRKYQYMVANELQLFDVLQAVIADDATLNQQPWIDSVRKIMISWTHSNWIPIVTIIRNTENNTITIRQKSKDLYTQEYWWIPLNFATAAMPNFERTSVDYFMPPVPEVTLTPQELGIHLHKHDWLIANKQQTGFYHVLYDEANLLALANILQENHTVIHPLNRAAIFQDLSPLIENNQIESVDVIFGLLKYLEHEKDLVPWHLVTDTVQYFHRNLFGTATHALYLQFVRRLVAPIFQKLFDKVERSDNLTNTEIITREKVIEIACMANLDECLEYTRQLAHDYIFRGVQFQADIEYAMHDSILCLGVKYLSDDEFNGILKLLSKSGRNSLWYDELIYALRCTQSRAHLNQYLNFLLGENSTYIIMNDNESMMYLSYLYKANLEARPVVWRFFEENYKALCHLAMFVENFNRIAEYVPMRYRSQFIVLRQKIALELESKDFDSNDMLIKHDSPRVGKKMKMSEIFIEQFGSKIHQWLIQDQAPQAYAASIVARNAASRNGSVLRVAGKLLKKLLKSNL